MIVACATLLYAFDPASSAFFPSCPLHAWAGWLCPGCGTLRAMHALVHGHVLAALHDNLLATLTVPLAAALTLTPRGDSISTDRRIPPAAILVGVGLMVTFGILRNIPGQMFDWVRP